MVLKKSFLLSATSRYINLQIKIINTYPIKVVNVGTVPVLLIIVELIQIIRAVISLRSLLVRVRILITMQTAINISNDLIIQQILPVRKFRWTEFPRWGYGKALKCVVGF